MEIIRLKIDVSRIDKAKLFKGEKGVYLDCALVPSKNNYGDDYMVVEKVTDADRKAGKRGTILGNGRIYKNVNKESNPAPPISEKNEQTDLPF